MVPGDLKETYCPLLAVEIAEQNKANIIFKPQTQEHFFYKRSQLQRARSSILSYDEAKDVSKNIQGKMSVY